MFTFRVWLLKLRIFILGIRFFKTEVLLDQLPFKTEEISAYGMGIVKVRFYKKEHTELEYRFGSFRSTDRVAYILTADLEGMFDEKTMVYNGTHFTFPLTDFLECDQDAVCRALIETYLDYLYVMLRKA